MTDKNMSLTKKRYAVHWRDQTVLEFTDGPGLLVSKVAPPPTPGSRLAEHPFISATAFVPEQEQKLLEILERSHDVDEYVTNLRAAGYQVVEEDS